MDSSIRICLKPESISWDEIHEVIWQSHEENRQNGVVMRYPSLPGDEIQKRIGVDGRMLVALTEEGKLIGTGAVLPKRATLWFGTDTFAYCCFASILPMYAGKGIYKEMCRRQEEIAREMGLDKMLFDTHEKNARNLGHSVKAGYKFVGLKYYWDHFNVVMVKWLDGCPYSDFRCAFHYHLRSAFVRCRVRMSRMLKNGNRRIGK